MTEKKKNERELFEEWWPTVGQTIGEVAAWQAWKARALIDDPSSLNCEECGGYGEIVPPSGDPQCAYTCPECRGEGGASWA